MEYVTTAKPGLVLSTFRVLYIYFLPTGLRKFGKQRHLLRQESNP